MLCDSFTTSNGHLGIGKDTVSPARRLEKVDNERGRAALLPFEAVGFAVQLSRLEAENAALRRQLIVHQRKVLGRVQFTNSDRLSFPKIPSGLGVASSRRIIA